MNRHQAVATAVGIGLPLSFLTGCAAAVEKRDECAVYDKSGEQVHPLSYPLGEISVKYRVNGSLFDGRNTTKGIVSESEGLYTLDVKDLPPVDDLASLNYERDDMAVGVTGSATGELGFSTGCMHAGEDSAGLETTLVEMPTN